MKMKLFLVCLLLFIPVSGKSQSIQARPEIVDISIANINDKNFQEFAQTIAKTIQSIANNPQFGFDRAFGWSVVISPSGWGSIELQITMDKIPERFGGIKSPGPAHKEYNCIGGTADAIGMHAALFMISQQVKVNYGIDPGR